MYELPSSEEKRHLVLDLDYVTAKLGKITLSKLELFLEPFGKSVADARRCIGLSFPVFRFPNVVVDGKEEGITLK